jgi:DNA-binding NarL/FixJ family response regulator
MSVRTIIAEDHKMVRDALALAVESGDEFTVVGKAADGEEALRLYEEGDVDFLLLDIRLPKISGLDLAKRIRARDKDVKILAMTMYEEASLVYEAMERGVDGYIFKLAKLERLLEAMRKIVRGEKAFDGFAEEKLKEYETSRAKRLEKGDVQKVELTKREKDVLGLVARGLTSKQIGDQLFISRFTVDNHRKNLLKKLGLRDSKALIQYANDSEIL